MERPLATAEWFVVSTAAAGAAFNCVKAAAPGVQHVVTSVVCYGEGAATAGKKLYLVIGGNTQPIGQIPSNATLQLDFASGIPLGEGVVAQFLSDAANGTTSIYGFLLGYTIGV